MSIYYESIHFNGKDWRNYIAIPKENNWVLYSIPFSLNGKVADIQASILALLKSRHKIAQENDFDGLIICGENILSVADYLKENQSPRINSLVEGIRALSDGDYSIYNKVAKNGKLDSSVNYQLLAITNNADNPFREIKYAIELDDIDALKNITDRLQISMTEPFGKFDVGSAPSPFYCIDEFSVIEHAIRCGSNNIATHIINATSDLKDPIWAQNFIIALENGNIEVAKLLLEKGIAVDPDNLLEDVNLHSVFFNKEHKCILNKLINQNIPISSKAWLYVTPQLQAGEDYIIDIVKYFLEMEKNQYPHTSSKIISTNVLPLVFASHSIKPDFFDSILNLSFEYGGIVDAIKLAYEEPELTLRVLRLYYKDGAWSEKFNVYIPESTNDNLVLLSWPR